MHPDTSLINYYSHCTTHSLHPSLHLSLHHHSGPHEKGEFHLDPIEMGSVIQVQLPVHKPSPPVIEPRHVLLRRQVQQARRDVDSEKEGGGNQNSSKSENNNNNSLDAADGATDATDAVQLKRVYDAQGNSSGQGDDDDVAALKARLDIDDGLDAFDGQGDAFIGGRGGVKDTFTVSAHKQALLAKGLSVQDVIDAGRSAALAAATATVAAAKAAIAAAALEGVTVTARARVVKQLDPMRFELDQVIEWVIG